jgi:hypothetical protein
MSDREAVLRLQLRRDDDYKAAGKPACDWDDPSARDALVDGLARDGRAALLAQDDRDLVSSVREAAELLATVLGQDLEQTADGRFRIARRVAADRVISTVDPEARHGHKTASRGFDGYKGHVAIDPDSELIVATEVTAANAGDATAAEALIGSTLEQHKSCAQQAEVYGDASYGTADLVERIENAGAEANVKVQAASPPRPGMFSQDDFRIDKEAAVARCARGVTVRLTLHEDGTAKARFGEACADCPLRAKCTTSSAGRTLAIHAKHETLVRKRTAQRDPEWRRRYRATRPKVERKIAHLMRRKHGGRRARVRGRLRVAHDFSLLAAAVNLARLAVLPSAQLDR